MRHAQQALIVAMAGFFSGCAGGFVYRPDPQPPRHEEQIVSADQDIYAAMVKNPLRKTAQKAAQTEGARSGPAAAGPPAAQSPPPLPIAKADMSASSPAVSDRKQATFYSLHLHSLKKYAYALLAQEKLAGGGGGAPAFIRKVDLPDSGAWYRVYLGKFTSRKEALVFAEQKFGSQAGGPIAIHELTGAAP